MTNRQPDSRLASIDALVRYHTAFSSMDDMMTAGGNYRPSLNTSAGDIALVRIADEYDARQAARGDSRRAYRY